MGKNLGRTISGKLAIEPPNRSFINENSGFTAKCSADGATEELTISKAIQLYIDFSKSKNLSDRTIEFYTFILNRALEQLNKAEYVKDITLQHLRGIVSKDLEKVSTTTVNHTIKTIRQLFTFLQDEGHVTYNPAARLKCVRCDRKLIQPFTNEQVKKLLAVPNQLTFTGLRDYTFMMMLLDTGLRLSEALSLTKKHINFNDNQIKVLGKGGRERIVPFGRTLKSLLRQYLDRVENVISDTDNIFLSDVCNDLTRNRIGFRIRQYGKAAGIYNEVRCSCHTFRHTFSVNFLRNGGNVFILQRILGHSTLDMTKRYVSLTFEDIAAAHAISSPLDNMSVIRPARSTQPKRKRLR